MYHPCVIKNPVGTFSLAGTLPVVICEKRRYKRMPGEYYSSKSYKNEGDAKRDLKIALILLVKDYLDDIKEFDEDKKAFCIAKWHGWL